VGLGVSSNFAQKQFFPNNEKARPTHLVTTVVTSSTKDT